jgi:hypothetical protein
MNITYTFCFLLLVTPLSWGSENFRSFLRNSKIGSSIPTGDEGINELPELEFFGFKFTAYHEIDKNRSPQSAGLYLRRKTSDVPVAEMLKIFAEMAKVISEEYGEAELFEVPNFEDATERTHSMKAWKNENSILVLQRIESPGRIELDVRHVNLDHFTSNLGADSGSFVLKQLETKSGDLRLSGSATPPQSPVREDSYVALDQKIEYPQGTDGVARRESSPQPETTLQSKEREVSPWPIALGVISILGLMLILVRNKGLYKV